MTLPSLARQVKTSPFHCSCSVVLHSGFPFRFPFLPISFSFLVLHLAFSLFLFSLSCLLSSITQKVTTTLSASRRFLLAGLHFGEDSLVAELRSIRCLNLHQATLDLALQVVLR